MAIMHGQSEFTAPTEREAQNLSTGANFQNRINGYPCVIVKRGTTVSVVKGAEKQGRGNRTRTGVPSPASATATPNENPPCGDWLKAVDGFVSALELINDGTTLQLLHKIYVQFTAGQLDMVQDSISELTTLLKEQKSYE
jgi:hypothetical protein